MKKAILMAVCSMGLLFTASAQVRQTSSTSDNGMNQVTQQDYEWMLQAQNQVAFRTYVINTLNLSEQQIKDFDPMYADYMKAKNELAKKKTKLINDYIDEIAENDSPRNEENDKEEFMEDYLELQVDESKLRKETFDRMEDKITADNAFGFFMIEDMVANDYYKNMLQRIFTPYVVITTEVVPSNATTTTTPKNATTSPTAKSTSSTPTAKKGVDRKYRSDIDAYSAWVRNDNSEVKDPHHYTRNGLTSLVAAISALGMACDVSNDQTFAMNKKKIMANSEKLGVNPSSNEHPDIMRESFIMAAEMLQSLQQKCNYPTSTNYVTQAAEAARKIDVSKTSMEQASVIKDFFKKAQVAIDKMANDISWSNN